MLDLSDELCYHAEDGATYLNLFSLLVFKYSGAEEVRYADTPLILVQKMHHNS